MPSPPRWPCRSPRPKRASASLRHALRSEARGYGGRAPRGSASVVVAAASARAGRTRRSGGPRGGRDGEAFHALARRLARGRVADPEVQRHPVVRHLGATVGSRDRAELARVHAVARRGRRRPTGQQQRRPVLRARTGAIDRARRLGPQRVERHPVAVDQDLPDTRHGRRRDRRLSTGGGAAVPGPAAAPLPSSSSRPRRPPGAASPPRTSVRSTTARLFIMVPPQDDRRRRAYGRRARAAWRKGAREVVGAPPTQERRANGGRDGRVRARRGATFVVPGSRAAGRLRSPPRPSVASASP